MTRTLLAAALLVVAADAAAFGAAPEEDYQMFTAYLAYPANGALNVSGNTLVFAADVSAMQLVGPGGETVTCLLDPTPSVSGAVFEPMELLTPGAYRVLGVPTERADNYAGPGITIDLGTFTVGQDVDEEAPSLELFYAGWVISDDGDNLSFDVGVSTDLASEPPLQFQIDLGDSDTLLDGTADATSPWTESTSFSAIFADLASIEPNSATVRVRAVDASGNVGPWSDPSSFDVMTVQAIGASEGCSAAPGRMSGRGGAVLVVSMGVLGMAARRRRFRGRR